METRLCRKEYVVEVDGKLLSRNRVHLKQDEQVTQPNLTSDTRKSKEQTEVPARQNTKVKPTRQTTKITEPPKCAKNMELRSTPNECKIVNFTEEGVRGRDTCAMRVLWNVCKETCLETR